MTFIQIVSHSITSDLHAFLSPSNLNLKKGRVDVYPGLVRNPTRSYSMAAKICILTLRKSRQNYRKDTEPLYHAFMYSPVSIHSYT